MTSKDRKSTGDWLRLITGKPNTEYSSEAQATADKILGGSATEWERDAGAPATPEEDRERTLGDVAREHLGQAAQMLPFGPPIEASGIVGYLTSLQEEGTCEISLSSDQRGMLRSIVGRELALAGIERMSLIQHKHHLRHLRGLTTASAEERIAFYDQMIAKLQTLARKIDSARVR